MCAACVKSRTRAWAQTALVSVQQQQRGVGRECTHVYACCACSVGLRRWHWPGAVAEFVCHRCCRCSCCLLPPSLVGHATRSVQTQKRPPPPPAHTRRRLSLRSFIICCCCCCCCCGCCCCICCCLTDNPERWRQRRRERARCACAPAAGLLRYVCEAVSTHPTST